MFISIDKFQRGELSTVKLDEQLWLIERLTQNIRKHVGAQNTLEDQLAAMAADPEIQNELRKINNDFQVHPQAVFRARL